MPTQLKYIAMICKCPALVVQIETRASGTRFDACENLWFSNALFALSLTRRDGLCLVDADGTVRRGIEARLLKSAQGGAGDERWMV